jgi:hypothetical protein
MAGRLATVASVLTNLFAWSIEERRFRRPVKVWVDEMASMCRRPGVSPVAGKVP